MADALANLASLSSAPCAMAGAVSTTSSTSRPSTRFLLPVVVAFGQERDADRSYHPGSQCMTAEDRIRLLQKRSSGTKHAVRHLRIRCSQRAFGSDRRRPRRCND